MILDDCTLYNVLLTHKFSITSMVVELGLDKYEYVLIQVDSCVHILGVMMGQPKWVQPLTFRMDHFLPGYRLQYSDINWDSIGSHRLFHVESLKFQSSSLFQNNPILSLCCDVWFMTSYNECIRIMYVGLLSWSRATHV